MHRLVLLKGTKNWTRFVEALFNWLNIKLKICMVERKLWQIVGPQFSIFSFNT